jgi:hypothetical protein
MGDQGGLAVPARLRAKRKRGVFPGGNKMARRIGFLPRIRNTKHFTYSAAKRFF